VTVTRDAAPLEAAIASSPDAPARTARLAVLGASGYAGQELVRLAAAHPGIELAALGSREHAGGSLDALLPGADSRDSPACPIVEPGRLADLVDAGAVDTVVSCLPHGAWKALAADHPRLAGAPRVLDLSADYRDGAAGYVYGLPELERRAIATASRIANPGCYPTAAALALAPAARAGWLAGPIMIHALSGVSGAGRAAQLRTSYVEVDGGASVYRAGRQHPHVPEIERILGRCGAALPAAFVPQLAPMPRGILLTASAPLARSVPPDEAREAYRTCWGAEPFVRLLDPDVWPETRSVRHSNRCDLAVTTLHGGRTLLAISAIDNLVKGAAGQAVQNLNLVLGWPETTALPRHGLPW
jgi:N-acetyl-gamma-glutamyl-phosphate reductase